MESRDLVDALGGWEDEEGDVERNGLGISGLRDVMKIRAPRASARQQIQ